MKYYMIKENIETCVSCSTHNCLKMNCSQIKNKFFNLFELKNKYKTIKLKHI